MKDVAVAAAVLVGVPVLLFFAPGYLAGRLLGRWGWTALIWPPLFVAGATSDTEGQEWTLGGLSATAQLAVTALLAAVMASGIATAIRAERRSIRGR